MAVAALDTHELVKDLRAAGFTEDQAEAVTRAVKQAQNLDLSHLATKADLAELSAKVDRLSMRMDSFGTRMDGFATKAELADSRAEIIKWVFTIAVGQGALIVALLKLLPGGHP